MQVIVNHLATNYQQAGSGKLVLVLPGWGDTAAGWTEFVGLLSKSYEVIVLDLPGFGGTQVPPKAWMLTDYADFVAAFLEKIQQKPYAILGHSHGGAIAVRGVGLLRLRPQKLILLAAAGVRGESKGRNKGARMIAKTGRLLAKPLPKRVQQRLRHHLYQSLGSDMLVVENLQETFKKVVQDDVRKDASNIGIPTLLVYGSNDSATPVHYGEAFQQAIKNSRLEILPDTEHFVHLEKPAEVERLVVEFLR